MAGGLGFTMESTPPQAGIFILLAVGLRLGVLPLHLTYRREPSQRRGFGTSLRLTAAASSLAVLARLPVSAIEARWMPFLLALTALAAIYGSWKWFWASDGLNARPYWMIGMGALSVAAALRGNPAGSAAWGTALILLGGVSFLYSIKHAWLTRLLAVFGLALLGLPFTLTASGWQGDFPFAYVFWPLFLLSQIFLAAGYVRHLFQPGEMKWSDLLRWTQAAYPMGLAVLGITIVLAGLWGWPGALIIGAWLPGLIASLLTGMLVLAFMRLRGLIPEATPGTDEPRPWGFSAFQDFLAASFWTVFWLARRLFTYVSILLEGDGGLLWTLLLLVLLSSFLRGR